MKQHRTNSKGQLREDSKSSSHRSGSSQKEQRSPKEEVIVSAQECYGNLNPEKLQKEVDQLHRTKSSNLNLSQVQHQVPPLNASTFDVGTFNQTATYKVKSLTPRSAQQMNLSAERIYKVDSANLRVANNLSSANLSVLYSQRSQSNSNSDFDGSSLLQKQPKGCGQKQNFFNPQKMLSPGTSRKLFSSSTQQLALLDLNDKLRRKEKEFQKQEALLNQKIEHLILENKDLQRMNTQEKQRHDQIVQALELQILQKTSPAKQAPQPSITQNQQQQIKDIRHDYEMQIENKEQGHQLQLQELKQVIADKENQLKKMSINFEEQQIKWQRSFQELELDKKQLQNQLKREREDNTQLKAQVDSTAAVQLTQVKTAYDKLQREMQDLVIDHQQELLQVAQKNIEESTQLEKDFTDRLRSIEKDYKIKVEVIEESSKKQIQDLEDKLTQEVEVNQQERDTQFSQLYADLAKEKEMRLQAEKRLKSIQSAPMQVMPNSYKSQRNIDDTMSLNSFVFNPDYENQQRDIKLLVEENDFLNQQWGKLSAQTREYREEIGKLQTEIRQMEDRQSLKQNELHSLTKDCQSLQSENNTLKLDLQKITDEQSLQKVLQDNELLKQKQEHVKDKSVLTEQLNQSRAQVTILLKEIDDLKQALIIPNLHSPIQNNISMTASRDFQHFRGVSNPNHKPEKVGCSHSHFNNLLQQVSKEASPGKRCSNLTLSNQNKQSIGRDSIKPPQAFLTLKDHRKIPSGATLPTDNLSQLNTSAALKERNVQKLKRVSQLPRQVNSRQSSNGTKVPTPQNQDDLAKTLVNIKDFRLMASCQKMVDSASRMECQMCQMWLSTLEFYDHIDGGCCSVNQSKMNQTICGTMILNNSSLHNTSDQLPLPLNQSNKRKSLNSTSGLVAGVHQSQSRDFRGSIHPLKKAPTPNQHTSSKVAADRKSGTFVEQSIQFAHNTRSSRNLLTRSSSGHLIKSNNNLASIAASKVNQFIPVPLPQSLTQHQIFDDMNLCEDSFNQLASFKQENNNSLLPLQMLQQKPLQKQRSFQSFSHNQSNLVVPLQLKPTTLQNFYNHQHHQTQVNIDKPASSLPPPSQTRISQNTSVMQQNVQVKHVASNQENQMISVEQDPAIQQTSKPPTGSSSSLRTGDSFSNSLNLEHDNGFFKQQQNQSSFKLKKQEGENWYGSFAKIEDSKEQTKIVGKRPKFDLSEQFKLIKGYQSHNPEPVSKENLQNNFQQKYLTTKNQQPPFQQKPQVKCKKGFQKKKQKLGVPRTCRNEAKDTFTFTMPGNHLPVKPNLMKELGIKLEEESANTFDDKFCLDSYRKFGKTNCTSTKGGQRYNKINLLLDSSESENREQSSDVRLMNEDVDLKDHTSNRSELGETESTPISQMCMKVKGSSNKESLRIATDFASPTTTMAVNMQPQPPPRYKPHLNPLTYRSRESQSRQDPWSGSMPRKNLNIKTSSSNRTRKDKLPLPQSQSAVPINLQDHSQNGLQKPFDMFFNDSDTEEVTLKDDMMIQTNRLTNEEEHQMPIENCSLIREEFPPNSVSESLSDQNDEDIQSDSDEFICDEVPEESDVADLVSDLGERNHNSSRHQIATNRYNETQTLKPNLLTKQSSKTYFQNSSARFGQSGRNSPQDVLKYNQHPNTKTNPFRFGIKKVDQNITGSSFISTVQMDSSATVVQARVKGVTLDHPETIANSDLGISQCDSLDDSRHGLPEPPQSASVAVGQYHAYQSFLQKQ